MNWDLIGSDPKSYSLAIDLFVRLLGVIYVIAYVPLILQIRGLFGRDGILPINEFLIRVKQNLGRRSYYYVPSLFWFNASDTALLTLTWSGLILGVLLIFGVFPPLILILLYIIHLSLVSAGQDFLSFGWETFLIEITFGAFLLTATTPHNLFAWLGLNVLLLRFYFQAGISKIFSQDKNWKNLSAIGIHYLSQPIPNTWAWYFHKLPLWFHKLSTVFLFYVELIIPWIIFAPPAFRLFAFTQFNTLQFFIWLTGNFSYLNHISAVSTLILIHNSYLTPYWSVASSTEPTVLIWNIFISCLGGLFLALQLISLWQTFFRHTLFNYALIWFTPFHLVSNHGIFAVMTVGRHEIVVEGSDNGVEWKEYLFYYKPGDISKRPKRISPFQPRLDWQAWFLPFGPFERQSWFHRFLQKLLEGSESVADLLKYNPFPNSPPLYIRALVYDYQYTSFEEKRTTGHWWKRKYIGMYSHTLQLAKPHLHK